MRDWNGTRDKFERKSVSLVANQAFASRAVIIYHLTGGGGLFKWSPLISSQFPLFFPLNTVTEYWYFIWSPWKPCDAPTPPPPKEILWPRLIPPKGWNREYCMHARRYGISLRAFNSVAHEWAQTRNFISSNNHVLFCLSYKNISRDSDKKSPLH